MAKENDVSLEDKIAHGEIFCRVIIEMLGGPKEHIVAVMKNYLEQLKKNEKIQIVKEFISEPEDQEKLFSIFSELEIWFSDFEMLIDFCFEAMPSSIEVLEPAEMKLKASEFSGLLNDLQAKIHTVDMAIKELTANNKILDNNAKNLLVNLIVVSLNKPKKLSQLSKDIGITEDKLEPFLKNLVDRGKLVKKDEKYEIASGI